ncbi:MAG: TRIC cation channel family protein, partial [Anaerovoracaceae bacterium]
MSFISLMELIGTVAFAVSGALVAIEKKLDYYGIIFLAIITAVGGGIIRDIIIN